MRPALLREVVLPAWQYVKRQNTFTLLKSLERTQWLSPDELADLQWTRAADLLAHASTHVPYYKEALRITGADARAIAHSRSLTDLPLLDRGTIRTHVSELKAVGLADDVFVPNGTGGSTGEPLRFFDDRREIHWTTAAVWRAQRWLGVEVGDRCAYVWGANFDISKFEGLTGRLRAGMLNMLTLPAWQLSATTAAKYWKQLFEFRPRLLVGYAGAMHQLARFLGSDRDPIPGLTAIVVSAETLTDDARQTIESCFKIPVYNRYGGRDLKFIAQECSQRTGLHINAETVIVEILKDGKPVSPGEIGEVTITRLDNFAMPFIRYRTGDLAVMASARCDCGRSLPLLARIEGRVQDGILLRDGRTVSGLFVAHMMKDCPDVREFQVHQLALDQLVIAVVLTNAPDFTSRERIERIVRAHVGAEMHVEIDVRDHIPLTRSGKRRIVVSHLPGSNTASEVHTA